jgi:hypothetical protein
MSQLTEAAVVLREMAAKAKATIEQTVIILAENEARESAILESRRASDDERAKINGFIQTLNGELKDISPSEIVTRAGVTKKQGTSAYARRQVQLLIADRSKK